MKVNPLSVIAASPTVREVQIRMDREAAEPDRFAVDVWRNAPPLVMTFTASTAEEAVQAAFKSDAHH